MNVTIVDYGMGNINSVLKKVKRIGANPIVTSDYKEIAKAQKIILPGVGHFGMAMENLKKLNLDQELHEAVLVKKTPVLGICLGMQLMASHSEEGDTKGLGWFDANIVRFKVKDPYLHKVPHTGWNTVTVNKQDNILMRNLPAPMEFYFVHAFHIVVNNPEDALNSTTYDYTFTSAIHKENIYGVQYHPEKSHDLGQALLNNFIQQ